MVVSYAGVVIAIKESGLLATPETNELEQDYPGINWYIVSVSVLIAYWMVYKPELLAAIYNTTVSTVGNIIGIVRNFLGITTGG